MTAMQHAQSIVDNTRTPRKENQSDALAEVNSTIKNEGSVDGGGGGYIGSCSVSVSCEKMEGDMVGAGDGVFAKYQHRTTS